jgi:hypothetical protein
MQLTKLNQTHAKNKIFRLLLLEQRRETTSSLRIWEKSTSSTWMEARYIAAKAAIAIYRSKTKSFQKYVIGVMDLNMLY